MRLKHIAQKPFPLSVWQNTKYSEALVCPPNLAKCVFTTSAYDNLDHNPTATTSTESFHATDISMFQHPSIENTIGSREKWYLLSAVFLFLGVYLIHI